MLTLVFGRLFFLGSFLGLAFVATLNLTLGIRPGGAGLLHS